MKKIFFFLIICFPLFSQEYKKPPEVISSMIEAEPQPAIPRSEKLPSRANDFLPFRWILQDQRQKANLRCCPKNQRGRLHPRISMPSVPTLLPTKAMQIQCSASKKLLVLPEVVQVPQGGKDLVLIQTSWTCFLNSWIYGSK